MSAGVLGAVSLGLAVEQVRDARELNERGLEAAKRGDPAAAEALYRQAMEEWRKKGPGYAAHLGITEYNLAQALCAQGHRREAAPALEDALALLRGSLGGRHLYTLSVLNYLGSVRLMQGDTAGAEVLFREALPVERELYPRNEQLSLTLGGLSSILVRQGRTAEALPLAEESLTLAIEVKGDQSSEAALAYANVAGVHKWAERYDRALPLYRKSLSIYERLLGPEHPRTASVLTEIGLMEMEDGDYTLAERDMQRSLDIAERSPGWAFEQWIGETNLGILRYRQGKYDDAVKLLTRSLERQEQAGVRTGRDLAITLGTLAKVREKQKRYDEAKQLREREAAVGAAH